MLGSFEAVMHDKLEVSARVDGVPLALELYVLKPSATSVSVCTVAPGQDRPEWELESSYLGAPSSRTRSLHLLAWRRGTASQVVEHRDAADPEACLPLCRPGACVEDHLARLVDLVFEQFGARLSVEVTDELLASAAAMAWGDLSSSAG